MNLIPVNLHEKIKISEQDKYCFDEYYEHSDFILVRKICNTEIELLDIWENSVHFVAGNIQGKLDKLELPLDLAWNIYLIFETTTKISQEVKNLIESDKFCCKKYVIQSVENVGFEELITKTIPLFSSFDEEGQSGQEGLGDESSILNQILENSKIHPDIIQIVKNVPDLNELTGSEEMQKHLTKLLESVKIEVSNG